MRKLFQIWLFLTVVSVGLYTPFYLFSNNALDAVEALTPEELIPLTGTRYDDPERKARVLKSVGIDLSRALSDALEDNARLSNVQFEYVEGPEARNLLLATGLRLVKASAEIKGGRKLSIVFGVQPKVFLRSVAQVRGVAALQISDGEHSKDFINDDQADMYLFTLFEQSGEGGVQSVERMVNRFDLHLAEQLAHEDARQSDSNGQASAPAKAQSAQAYFQQALAQGNWTSEPVPPQPTPAPDEESAPATLSTHAADSAQQPADPATGPTVAGNPNPGTIIIFQFDGQPAYCADEGIDGPNCRGDASSWIGQGTYKDYMDAGSATCIAGEPECKLPKYFPSDIRG